MEYVRRLHRKCSVCSQTGWFVLLHRWWNGKSMLGMRFHDKEIIETFWAEVAGKSHAEWPKILMIIRTVLIMWVVCTNMGCKLKTGFVKANPWEDDSWPFIITQLGEVFELKTVSNTLAIRRAAVGNSNMWYSHRDTLKTRWYSIRLQNIQGYRDFSQHSLKPFQRL